MSDVKRCSMRKFISMAAVLILWSTAFPTYAAGDAYNPLETPVGRGNLLQYIVEDGNVERNSYIALMPPAVTSANEVRMGKWKWCTSLVNTVCDPKLGDTTNLKAISILGPCKSDLDENCIESVEIGKQGALAKATLIRMSDGVTFPANPDYNFPGGSTISLWSAPSAPSASGSTTYAVMPRMQLYYRNGRLYITEFFADIIPYREITGDFRAMRFNTRADVTPETAYDFAPHGQTCVYEEDGRCGIAQDFTEDARARLKIRISKDVGGWFSGRLKDQSIEVSDFSTKNNLLTIEASPVVVPRMAHVVSSANLDDEQKVWFENNGRWPTTDNGTASGAQAGVPQYVFPFLAYYRPKVKDTATNSNTFWNFITTSWGSGSKCLQDTTKVLGIVSTNAMAYNGQAPSFEDGSLNYRVAGLHLSPDGKIPNFGTYNLVMRSETARCLYNFSDAPVSATISIAGEGGGTVATTVTSEKNGWLSLSASGFTFSEKLIQVKMTQEPVKVVAQPLPTPSPSPTATPTLNSTPQSTLQPSKPRKVSITCIKGKTKKVVSSRKPICPSGYKKV